MQLYHSVRVIVAHLRLPESARPSSGPKVRIIDSTQSRLFPVIYTYLLTSQLLTTTQDDSIPTIYEAIGALCDSSITGNGESGSSTPLQSEEGLQAASKGYHDWRGHATTRH